MEQELYDSRSMLEFAGLSLSEPIPDETTILHFRQEVRREMHQTRKGRQWYFGMKLHSEHGCAERRDRGASPVARR